MRHIWLKDDATDGAELGSFRSPFDNETTLIELGDDASASATDVLVAVVLCAVILSTVIGNILALMAVCRISLARSVSHVYIGCLAVSDLLIGLFIMPPIALVTLDGRRSFDGSGLDWLR